MKKFYILAATLFAVASTQAQVVISQVYGGGGNTGATYTHDYVELFNRGTEAVNIGGWSIQYASATGSNWNNITVLPDFTLQPGQYYLIQQAEGAGGTEPLPTPDFIPGEDNTIAMGGTNLKILLANTDVQVESVSNPTDSQIVDLVGFGTANYFEGAVGPALSNTTAGFRAENGCQDTDDNSVDFVTGDPAPRNSTSPLNVCDSTVSVKDNSIAGLSVYPNPLSGNTLYVTSNNSIEKSVAIFDVLGKQVVNTTTLNGTVNLNLNAGVYIVKITEEGKTATRKLVVR